MQLEIIQQHSETSNQMRELAEAAGFDYETIASLPENIRQEVLEQARREQRNNELSQVSESVDSTAGRSNDIDNATFLASLPLELRSEILMTADPEFLASLPSEIVAEAQVLRERAASNWQRRELIARSVPRGESNVNSGETRGQYIILIIFLLFCNFWLRRCCNGGCRGAFSSTRRAKFSLGR
jgi:hypothetical protein